MIVKNEPYLIEYNVRMGDPECQTIIPKLKTDLSKIFMSCCNGNLNEINIEWSNKKSLCIVVCSKGYPEEFKKNVEIQNINNLETGHGEFCFHAGTLKKNIESRANNVVTEVIKVRDKVSFIEMFVNSKIFMSEYFFKFSLTLSKITTVSFIE